MTGSSATAVWGLAAANKIINKSVFCIDNADPKFNEVTQKRLSNSCQILLPGMSCFL